MTSPRHRGPKVQDIVIASTGQGPPVWRPGKSTNLLLVASNKPDLMLGHPDITVLDLPSSATSTQHPLIPGETGNPGLEPPHSARALHSSCVPQLDLSSAAAHSQVGSLVHPLHTANILVEPTEFRKLADGTSGAVPEIDMRSQCNCKDSCGRVHLHGSAQYIQPN